MQDKRQYKRYSLNLLEIDGKMSLTDKVKILDISQGGVAIQADRRLNIGKEYLIKLQEKGKTLDVKSVVVRSELSGTEERSNGERVTIYTAGMIFKEGYADKIADFLKPIAQNTIKKVPPAPNRRLHVRFSMTTPQEKILSYPLNFRVKEISLSGMLIQTDQTVELNSNIPMELSLGADKEVTFIGRVASSTKTEIAGQTQNNIGVEFTDLKNKDKALIKTFIDYLAEIEAKNSGEKTGN